MADPSPSRRPTTLVLAAVGLFVLAVVLGRLLVAGGAAWGILVVSFPVLLLALGKAVGFRAAAVLVVMFTATVLATRWLILDNPAGWVALLLLPVVALTGMIVGKVLAQLRGQGGAEER